MNYEIVDLKQKILVGVSAVTGNNDPKMGEIISRLWAQLYQNGIHAGIKNKTNGKAIGLYSDYQGDTYRVTVGYDVTQAENTKLTTKIIPAGKYAKFSVHGDMHQAVAEAWGKIRDMDLERSYTGDFEEYLNADIQQADIDIYIALKG